MQCYVTMCDYRCRQKVFQQTSVNHILLAAIVVFQEPENKFAPEAIRIENRSALIRTKNIMSGPTMPFAYSIKNGELRQNNNFRTGWKFIPKKILLFQLTVKWS